MRILAVLPLLVAPALGPPSIEAPSVEAPSVELVETTPRSDLAGSLEVLHDWDARRARAWAEVDATALRALYVRASTAGRSDVRLLRAYDARGIVVRRLVTQVFAVRVLHRDASTVRVRVFDRVAGGVLVHAGQELSLRSSQPVTRTIVFRRVSGSWRVSGISGSGPGLHAALP